MRQHEKSLLVLKDLGLNAVEAEVYLALLANNDVTAYKIGKIINKPTANVYKAMDALAAQGAVCFEEGDNRTCHAIDPEEFIAQARAKYLDVAARAVKTLGTPKPHTPEGRVLNIASASLALARVKEMIGRAVRIVVVDAFPNALSGISEALKEAHSRGVQVFVQSYISADLPGISQVLTHRSAEVLRFWEGEQLNVVVDGEESLFGFFDETLNQARQVVWTNSLYMSCMLHMGLMREHAFHQVWGAVHRHASIEDVKAILSDQRGFHESDVPGQIRLFEMFQK